MKIIANRQLRGEYGLLVPGKQYEVKAHIAADLLSRGLVSEPPASEPEPELNPDPQPDPELQPAPKKKK